MVYPLSPALIVILSRGGAGKFRLARLAEFGVGHTYAKSADQALRSQTVVDSRRRVSWTSAQLERLPIQPNVRLNRDWIGESSVGETALLGYSHQARDLIPGLFGFDIYPHLETEAATLDRATQDGAFSKKAHHLVDLDLLQLQLHQFP
jgi:hypothetical protein